MPICPVTTAPVSVRFLQDFIQGTIQGPISFTPFVFSQHKNSKIFVFLPCRFRTREVQDLRSPSCNDLQTVQTFQGIRRSRVFEPTFRFPLFLFAVFLNRVNPIYILDFSFAFRFVSCNIEIRFTPFVFSQHKNAEPFPSVSEDFASRSKARHYFFRHSFHIVYFCIFAVSFSDELGRVDP